jgi:hypothetical protein
MATKVLTGGRAKVYVNNNLVGIFETCTFNVNVGTEPIHILGRYSPDEITPTSYEAVTLSCSGFRIVGAGPYTGSPSANNQGVGEAATVGPAFPMLQDLLNLDPVTISVVDRQTGATILTAIGCVPNSWNGNHNARATSRVTINYTGLRISDESGAQDEGNGAVNLP